MYNQENMEPPAGQVTLFAKTLIGQSFVFQAVLTQTIQQIKHKLSPLMNVSAQDIRLIYCGKSLEDGRTLWDYRCQDQGTLHVVLRLRRAVQQAA